MTTLLLISIAPVLMILLYIYYRDKHEKEPLKMLILSVLFGALAVIPILILEIILSIPAAWMAGYMKAGWEAFVVAAFSEELFKFLVIMIFIWRSKHFNEPFDGIVYAVYVSLGFALVENILYVIEGGATVALLRAITAVPAHAIFGIGMGYYLGLAKYQPAKRSRYISMALLFPILLHGVYDFILMSEMPFYIILFFAFVIGLYIFAFRHLKKMSVYSGKILSEESETSSASFIDEVTDMPPVENKPFDNTRGFDL